MNDGDVEFYEPNAHVLYESVEGMDFETDRNVTNESGERGNRGVRSRRGRARGRPRGGRSLRRGSGRISRAACGTGGRWAFGEPLTEVWLTDDDVPSQLRSVVMDVTRTREAKAQGSAIKKLQNRVRQNKERKKHEGDIDSEDDDTVFYDSLLEPEALQFDWSPMETWKSQEECFLPQRTGSVVKHDTPYTAFRSYWDDKILQHIADETNRSAAQITSAAFKADWYPTNMHEILILFSFWMMLGIIRLPSIKSCFSEDPLLKTGIFSQMFTLRRYNILTRALNFVNDATIDEKTDKLARLRTIITHLNQKFQENYVLSQDICIDESLTLWKGKLNIAQCIRSKAAKIGIKTFELCESATGYLWSFIVYSGKVTTPDDDAPESSLLKSTKVVVQLMRPLLNKGYRLFMDNRYNSPLLARFLKRNRTDCVGTLRPTRRDVPPLINLAQLEAGQLVARHSGDVCVMVCQDTKKITTISTCHGTAVGLPTVSTATPSRPVQFKPQVVLDYNKHMGGVDLKDQMLEPYLIERKRCAKWYMKLFKRLLNCSILNSRILLQSSTKRHQEQLEFRLRLVEGILDNHIAHCPCSRSQSRIVFEAPSRFAQSHWPVRNEQRESDTQINRKSRQRCYFCFISGRKKSQKTPFKCETCNVPLCIEGCFKSYHLDKKMPY